jgi:uncharacterized protein (TIGR02145 family)
MQKIISKSIRILSSRFFPILILGIVLILTNSCKKEEPYITPTTVTDIDGNEYKTVTIGTQIWMSENLKTTRYRNGELIGTTIPNIKDISGEIEAKYQWIYEGNESNANSFGRLYTWFTITDNRKVCPSGWHIPSNSEWETLISFLGGEYVAGFKLMEISNLYWINNERSTNGSGFTARAGGERYINGTFDGMLSYGQWWSSSDNLTSGDWGLCREIHYWDSVVSPIPLHKACGLSIRCIKD